VIIERGVLVDEELAPVVVAMIAEAVRRDPSRDRAELRRLRADWPTWPRVEGMTVAAELHGNHSAGSMAQRSRSGARLSFAG
jgi:hypothetical protein